MEKSDSATKIDFPTLVLSEKKDPKRILIQKCKLLAVSGPLQGKEFIMNKDVFTIGSGPHNDLVLQDTTVSRRHSEIQLVPEGYAIRDLGSTNGTIVQGVKVTEAFLNQGTEFQLGKTKLVFCPLQEAMEYTLSPREAFGALIGKSVAMRRVFHLAETYSSSNATVLIEGETGTGKDVLAEEIHRHSERSHKPFVVIDCASLAKDLITSELFGHKKGAFTGANSDRVGAFEHANGGTVFLDEIGALDLDLQPKLLRVLERRELKRLGSNETRKIDVRIVCATNRKLQNEVNAERFREDLYFRLSVVNIELPPLRRRKEDIPLLTEKFLCEFHGREAVKEIADFDKTMKDLNNHDWPGNVRELRNLVEVAFYNDHRPVNLGAFLFLSRMRTREEVFPDAYAIDRPFKVVKGELIRNFERKYLGDLLNKNDWNISKTAREAEIERAYLQRLIRKYELKR